MKLSLHIPSGKTAFTFLVMLVCVALYASGMWYIHHLKTLVGEKASQLATETTRETSLRHAGGFLSEIGSETAALDSFFVTPEDKVTAIEEAEGLGTSLGVPVKISNARIVGADEAGEGIMLFDLSAEGSWATVTDLAALLDTFPYASKIDEMTLDKIAAASEETPSKWRLRTTMQLWLRK